MLRPAPASVPWLVLVVPVVLNAQPHQPLSALAPAANRRGRACIQYQASTGDVCVARFSSRLWP